MTIAVTGASGQLGRATIEILRDKGAPVIGLARALETVDTLGVRLRAAAHVTAFLLMAGLPASRTTLNTPGVAHGSQRYPFR